MKKTVLLFSAILAMLVSCQKVDKTQIAIDNIMTRTSIRAYQDKPVEDEKVEMLLKAGMAAPTACNKQPWSFEVVTDHELLQTLADSCPNAKMAAQAPLAIIVCGDMTQTLEGEGADFWIQDASAATENILLAANAMGLGAVWTGFYPGMDRVKKAREIFGIPSNQVVLCVIPIGYPGENPTPKDKWKPEKVHYNKW